MLPLVRSMLPSCATVEALELNKVVIPVDVTNKTETEQKCKIGVRFAKLLLAVAIETADAVIQNQYRSFDPLVKNFGCQISAVDMCELFSNANLDDLCQEAVQVKAYATIKLQELGSTIPKCGRVPRLAGIRSLEEFLIQKAKVDLQVSPTMSRLLRMRILCIVNDNKRINDREVPLTNIESLVQRLGEVTGKVKARFTSILTPLVQGLQAEESMQAAVYIRQKGLGIANADRRDLVCRALQLERKSAVKYNCPQTPIVSVPLLFNTEAALTTYTGLVCVKNKLTICGEPIVGAVAKKIFLQMPGGIPVKDVSARSSREPIMVIEGYMKEPKGIKARILACGLTTIILANCASKIVTQYAGGASKDPLTDIEAENEVQRYASSDFDTARSILELDHFYCSSLEMEAKK
ncbi:MAG: hypothetical protein LLF94_07460 [Chlamydiales bacterium]|nr:hypothetical protein [Chlamydiales bacterium]